MLTQIRIQRYKSLYDTTVDLEPLTVFIGPNGSGKSNICESLYLLSNLSRVHFLERALEEWIVEPKWQAKFWHGELEKIQFDLKAIHKNSTIDGHVSINSSGKFSKSLSPDLEKSIASTAMYNFNPALLAEPSQRKAGPRYIERTMASTGYGIANSLADILFDNRDRFVELEKRFIALVPNIARISLQREDSENRLRLADKFSEHLVPAEDISDGTLRILAFLTALYNRDNPQIICFEEPENGVHPWLLHKMMELLNLVSTEGIGGKPVQVLITTHSPVLLNYVKPEQVRVVELDKEGKTQVHKLPTDSVRFRKAMEAYDHEVGELWFTNVIGGNPT